jgi:hypothetical protein
MKMLTLLLVLPLSMSALAQDRTFLPKADVEALASGKKWVQIRAADQNKVIWDIQSDGAFFGSNVTTNQRDNGTWLVNEQAQLCVKWRGRSPDRCVAVLKDGENFKMVDSNDLQGTYAELTVE